MSNDQAGSWLSFGAWLEAQRGLHLDDSAQPDDSPRSDQPAREPTTSLDHRSTCHADDALAHGTSRLGRTSSPSIGAPLTRDCRMETRLTDGPSRGRQAMTIMLAAPGMPLNKAPLITTRQASALLAALCEPLVQLSVGRLTRRLEAPTMLSPTEERGVLSLWLLPNDDLSLVWQGRDASRPGTETSSSTVRHGGESSDVDTMVWEELARFPAGMHPGTQESIVTIHMLRGDPSGRSFYIRPKIDSVPIGPGQPDGGHPDLERENRDGRRMYFWLTNTDVPLAMHNLGRLKSLIKRPPSLSKRSGVPQRHLNDIADWVVELDGLIHRSTSIREAPSPGVPSVAASLFNNQGQFQAGASRTVQREGTQLAARGAVSATAAAVYKDRRFQLSAPCSITVGTSVVLRCPADDLPTTASVDDVAQNLSERAIQEARGAAEAAARRIVERTGRRRLEEVVCESLIRSVRAQRIKAKADMAEIRGSRERQMHAQEAQVLIRRAVLQARGRGRAGDESCKLAFQLATVAEAQKEDAAMAWTSEASRSSYDDSETGPDDVVEGNDGKSVCAGFNQTQNEISAGMAAAGLPRCDSNASKSNGRVTIDNLQTLLKATDMEIDTEGGGRCGSTGRSAATPTEKVRITDLPDLLHSRPERE